MSEIPILANERELRRRLRLAHSLLFHPVSDTPTASAEATYSSRDEAVRALEELIKEQTPNESVDRSTRSTR